MKKEVIFIATLPRFMGYGLTSASRTEAGALKSLADEYARRVEKLKPPYHRNWPTFKQTFQDLGGSVSEVELDKPYFQDFQK